MSILEINHFSKTYKGAKKAVDNLTLTVEPGDIYAFIGHNGAGKSTTMRAIAGILDFEEGDIRIDGMSIKSQPLECKSIFAYIPDNPDLYEHLTGIGYLNFIGDIFGLSAKSREQDIRKYGDEFEITANTVTGVMMAILLSGGLMLLGPDKLAEILKEPAAAKYMLQASPYAAAAFLGMCCTTMASVSLEGKSLWILQSMPVNMKDIMNSKILVNLTATVPGALISATMLVIGMKPGLAGGVVYYLLLLAFGVGTAVWGLLINLMIPNYEWESETQVVKQSLPAFLGMFPLMLLGVLLGAVAAVLPVDYRLTGLGVSLLLFGGSYILYLYMMKKYKKMPV